MVSQEQRYPIGTQTFSVLRDGGYVYVDKTDMVMKTDDTVYIFELKFNGSAEEALAQIDLKNYPERFALCDLPIVKVGVNFSSKTRTLDGWAID